MSNWSLNKKIWSIVGLLAFAFVVSTAFSIHSLLDLRTSMNEVTGNVVKRNQLSFIIKDNQRRISLIASEALIIHSPEELKANIKDFEEMTAKQEKDIEAYRALASEKGKAILGEYVNAYNKYLSEMKKVRALAANNKVDEGASLYVAARHTYVVPMREQIETLSDLTSGQLSERSASADAESSRAIWVGLIISTFSILSSILIAFFVLRAVTRAISDVVKNLSDSSIQVSGAATQIASSSEELSQAATEQAASLEETAASIEEMNSMVAKNTENASSAAQTSSKSQDAVSEGKQVIQKMIESMEAINRSSEGMAETVKVIEQIDKKTKVINDIVNKTELLSFNASVEAARAGEHGKGFAVVAEEVGNLARMSGAAAEEIASLLEESINKVNQMVADTKKNVDTGAEVTRECGAVFEAVVENVTRVSGMASEIASASQEQSRGCAEITKAMTQLDQMTQQNAATSEECASAAEELSAQAESLKGAVSQLVLTVNGGNGQAQTFDARAVTPKLARTAAIKPPTNVVHMKGPKPSPQNGANVVIKKASGSAPGYESDGFQDV